MAKQKTKVDRERALGNYGKKPKMTKVDKAFVITNDNTISLRAKGLYFILLNLPGSSSVNPIGLIKRYNSDSLLIHRRAVAELIAAGYVKRREMGVGLYEYQW